MEKEEGYLRASTYMEFRRRYESIDSLEREALKPARDFIVSVQAEALGKIMSNLVGVARKVAKETGIATNISKVDVAAQDRDGGTI